MQTTHPLLAALLVAVVAPAQADAAPTASAELDQLTAEWKVAQDAYRAAYLAVTGTDEYKAAAEKKDRARMRELVDAVPAPDGAAFGARAVAAAKRYEGDDQLKLLVWAATQTGDKPTAAEAIERIAADHLQSARLAELLEQGPVLRFVLGAGEAEALLERVAAESPHAEVRAWALYWQAVTLQRDKASDEEKQRAMQLLADAEKLAAGTPLAERVAAPRFEAERLQIGMVAPDIEGEDLDGQRFALGDYRGKVVVLDFWGFW